MKPTQFGITAGFLAVVALGLLLVGRPSARGPAVAPEAEPPRPEVTAVGEALVWTKPDVANLTFRIRVQGATAEEAEALLSASSEETTAALVRTGLRRSEIRVAGREVHPIGPAGPALGLVLGPQAVRYEAEAALEVEVRDLNRMEAVVAAALAAGTTDYEGAVYGLQSARAAQDQAIAEALKRARERAAAVVGLPPQRLGELLRSRVEVSVADARSQESIAIRAQVEATFAY